jgi:hypothetical protein
MGFVGNETLNGQILACIRVCSNGQLRLEAGLVVSPGQGVH